jgi:hypothetical protein
MDAVISTPISAKKKTAQNTGMAEERKIEEIGQKEWRATANSCIDVSLI